MNPNEALLRELADKILSTQERKKFMISYLKLKTDEEDWHGCCDAANDLREIEVEIKIRKEFLDADS